MIFIFNCVDGDTRIDVTFRAETLNELVSQFDCFVRGCGFVPKGEIKDVFDPSDVLCS